MADVEVEDGVNDSGEDMEAMAAAKVLEKLEELWMNERFSPELLEAKTEFVECVIEQIQAMEDNIYKEKKGDFKVSIHRMEVDRIRYILSSYLRARLEKIQKYARHILDEENKRSEDELSHLSPEEYVFAKEYSENLESHLRNLVLKHMPPNLQLLDPKQTATQPNLDSYVFFHVNDDINGVLVDEETREAKEEIVDFQKGQQHIMRYRPIKHLVASGEVTLI